jgi:hypothetical protein
VPRLWGLRLCPWCGLPGDIGRFSDFANRVPRAYDFVARAHINFSFPRNLLFKKGLVLARKSLLPYRLQKLRYQDAVLIGFADRST